jgi:hypothetical protein
MHQILKWLDACVTRIQKPLETNTNIFHIRSSRVIVTYTYTKLFVQILYSSIGTCSSNLQNYERFKFNGSFFISIIQFV